MKPKKMKPYKMKPKKAVKMIKIYQKLKLD